MELQGKVVKVLPTQQGESARGVWSKQEFILETQGQYPKKVCISLWNDKIQQSNIKQGEEITASINLESREYNERWYTEVKAWKIQKETTKAPKQEQAPKQEVEQDEEFDSLPF